MPPPPSARCAKHVDAAAVDVCQRCGSFVCGACSNVRREDVYCPSCTTLLDRPASSLPQVAFSIAISAVPALSLTLIPLVGILGLAWFFLAPSIAIVLLLQERTARRSSETPASTTFYRLAWGAVAFDAVSIGLLGFLIFYFLKRG